MNKSALTLAIPNKGRLREPSLRLLKSAGMSFEVTDRALSLRVRNVDVDLVLVRTEDIPGMLIEGVADVGITGLDLMEESDPDGSLAPLVKLDFGFCRLAAAVPNASSIDSLEDLRGLRVATSHPRTTARFLSRRGIPASVVALKGSVEAATKIALADAVVDLVSTGSTLRLNGLRDIGVLLESQAVLAGLPQVRGRRLVRQLVTAVRAVTAGRRKRYLLLNTSVDKTAEISRLMPGLSAPTIVPLDDSEMVAMHSVVDASDLWDLLPRLEDAGGKGILVLDIGQLIP
ncbi:MAG: ATP phosphoribosyltransferase [Acidimicrobiia bacterium]|nr:ATP phosphoribosyltransferase [bacterium]MXX01616.1 ATP phosphoribosyltransferase [Acidimicrobiia bacterium]MDE0673615.1 ATP phosphoribosyltransferase [bacterium]MXX45423.1 ATP phosphoribosyltransferase [Acidimicrobiia bacterium]MXY74944.1 ATP phosphoribosyltransferase [Acidimicrobiia bacterium]